MGVIEHFYEPLTTLAFLAGATRHIKLGVSVYVMPYRNPVVTAKIVATLDALSEGRVIFGVGVGWLREEFTALGQDARHPRQGHRRVPRGVPAAVARRGRGVHGSALHVAAGAHRSEAGAASVAADLDRRQLRRGARARAGARRRAASDRRVAGGSGGEGRRAACARVGRRARATPVGQRPQGHPGARAGPRRRPRAVRHAGEDPSRPSHRTRRPASTTWSATSVKRRRSTTSRPPSTRPRARCSTRDAGAASRTARVTADARAQPGWLASSIVHGSTAITV
jgi:alkanesulfonate monooxygenase SsuD/methylene tetrahydromethanopterin reductase-like flavin-dependent oxidoreductase (luciferase family)